MKSRWLYGAVVFVLMVVAANIWPVLASGAQVGQLEKIQGPANVTRSDGEKIEGRVNLSLMPGDQIETGKGGRSPIIIGDRNLQLLRVALYCK